MIGKGHEVSKVANISEVVEILEERKKKGELAYEQNVAYEHAKKFAKLSKRKADELASDLKQIGISDKAVAKIIEIMPVTDTQLKQVLVIGKKQVDEEVIKGILEILAKYKSG